MHEHSAYRILSSSEFRSTGGRSPWRLLKIGARLRSAEVVEELVSVATEQEANWSEVEELFRSEHPPELPPHWSATRIAVAALLSCVLEPDADSFDTCIRLLRSHQHRIDFGKRKAGLAVRLATQIAARTGADDVFRWCRRWKSQDKSVRWAAKVDLRRPACLSAQARSFDPADEQHLRAVEKWWRGLGRPFRKAGLEPFGLTLDLIGSGTPLFTAIQALAPDDCQVPEDEQPLVTVVVPTYNPSENFLSTIQSLTRQSWSNIEVIVVDDCSATGIEYFRVAAASDHRVRVIRLEENGGAYRARNAGMEVAAGTFLTFQDADDLSHPRRIERQILPLLRDPDLVATTSRMLRITEECYVTYLGFLPQRKNLSSLLLRTAVVRERLGEFDAIRKGADSEFVERLTAAFGENSLLHLKTVLSIVQLTEGSLSRADFRPQWKSGGRAAYMSQYRSWHRKLLAQKQSNWRLDSSMPRPFAAHPIMLGSQHPTTLAVAVLSDWGEQTELAEAWTPFVAELAQTHGAPVGLLRGLKPKTSRLTSAVDTEAVTDLVEETTATWLSWSDKVSVDTLVITDPRYLTYLPQRDEVGIRARNVHVLLPAPLRGAEDEPALPPVDWCARRVRRLFGGELEWITSSGRIFQSLAQNGAEVRQEVSYAGAEFEMLQEQLGAPEPEDHPTLMRRVIRRAQRELSALTLR